MGYRARFPSPTRSLVSARTAMIGSTFDARRAGIQLASKATTIIANTVRDCAPNATRTPISFVRRHRIRQHAVDAHRREQQRDGAERRQPTEGLSLEAEEPSLRSG